MAKHTTAENGTADATDKKARKAARLALEARNADPFAEQRDALRTIRDQLDELSTDRELSAANRKAALEFLEAIDDGDGSGLIPDHCAEPEEETESGDDD